MKFAKDVGITFVTRILTLLTGVVTSIIIARTLGPKRQGIYSLTILLPLMIVTFTNLGIGRSTIYHIGKNTHSFKNLIGTILTSSFIISIVSILIGAIIVFFFSNSILPGVPQKFLLLALLLIPFQLLSSQSLNGILLGIQKIKEYNIIAIIQSSSMLVLVALFLIRLNLGVAGAIIANLLSLLLATILAFFYVFRSSENLHPSSLFDFDKSIFSSLFSFGYKAHLGSVFAFLHLRIDTFMLNYFLNPMAVGFYAISVGITEKLWLLSQAVSTVLYPKVASMKDEEQRNRFTPIVARNTLLITILGAFLFFLLSKWLILLLYSDKFLPSVAPFQILLIGVVAISVERVLVNDILARGKPMINAYITFVALIANVILNVTLIPKYGVIGAAWATSITYGFNAIVKILIYCKLSGNSVFDVIVFKKSDIKLYLSAITATNNKIRHWINFYVEKRSK